LEKTKQNLRVQSWVVLVAVILFTLKILAYFLTHSVAVLTDALESTVNVVAGFIGLYSLYIAAKPRDEDHPYGHGKAEFLSAAVEGALITIAGFIIIYEAIDNFIHPRDLRRLDYGMLLLAIAGAINFIVGYISVKKGKKNNSIALIASGRHLQSDTYSTIAILGGLAVIYFTKLNWMDSVVSIILALIIIVTGYHILRNSVAGIMDEADKKILTQMILLLNQYRDPNWIDIHNFRVIKFGSVLHVDCHLTLPWYFNIVEAHVEIKKLIQLIANKFGESIEFFVHADNCIDPSCPICFKTDCQVRKHPFVKKIEWNLENIISNQKHKLSS